MAETRRPLLFLPQPTRPPRKTRPRGFPSLTTPGYEAQGRRLGEKFRRLNDILQGRLSATDDPTAIAPERALVFEVYGDLREFQKIVEKYDFEWLFEIEGEFDLIDGFSTGKPKDTSAAGRLYLSMPTVESLKKLRSLWIKYRKGETAPDGDTPWWRLFDHLKDIRPWGPQDRILSEDRRRWADVLDGDPDERVRVEAEVWFHSDPVKREAAARDFKRHLTNAEAEIIDRAEIAEISYSAVLLELPRSRLQGLYDQASDITLLRIDEIQFVRPQSMASLTLPGEPLAVMEREQPLPTKETIRGALFDGYPLENHPLLAGLLQVEDPDNLAPLCPVNQRYHGTAMASLILHGDLNEDGETLPYRLHVRPLMVGDPAQPHRNEGMERFPDDKLVLPSVYRAVRRMKEGENGQEPDAPDVIVVNHSLGDAARPFTRFVSPWARLLDWLAYEYRLLFVVSAGNCSDPLPVPEYASETDCINAAPQEREREIVMALDARKAARRLISPAEALNVLTIGALHRDGQTPPPDVGSRLDPFPGLRTAAIYSRMGLGHRGSIKPELAEAGGRATVSVMTSDGQTALRIVPTFRGFGQRAAAPAPSATGGAHVADSCGTSNAAALTTRAALRIIDTLEDLRAAPGAPKVVEDDYLAVVTKALLAHGASWFGSGDVLDDIVEPQAGRQWLERRRNIARQIGYGAIDIDRVLWGTQHRVTLVGAGEIGADEAQLFRMPVPPSLFGKRVKRRVAATLAWLTPVNANHQQYRRGILELAPPQWEKTNWPAGKGNGVAQPPDGPANGGTLIHRIFEDQTAMVRNGDGTMSIAVQCRSPGRLDGRVPYALAITLEVAEGIGAGIDIHEEVRSALHVRV